MTKVGLLDYGSGNLHSAARALAAAGADVTQAAKKSDLWDCDALVVPGVGAYSACMAALREIGGDELIWDWINSMRPLLGICVGHQVLFSGGTEHGVHTQGLGVYPGVVTQLDAQPLPHMGWNTVEVAQDTQLFEGLADERFYFVHSYAAAPAGSTGETLATHNGATFVAAIEQGLVCSTQFHPEKSGAAGARLLRNWLASA